MPEPGFDLTTYPLKVERFIQMVLLVDLHNVGVGIAPQRDTLFRVFPQNATVRRCDTNLMNTCNRLKSSEVLLGCSFVRATKFAKRWSQNPQVAHPGICPQSQPNLGAKTKPIEPRSNCSRKPGRSHHLVLVIV